MYQTLYDYIAHFISTSALCVSLLRRPHDAMSVRTRYVILGTSRRYDGGGKKDAYWVINLYRSYFGFSKLSGSIKGALRAFAFRTFARKFSDIDIFLKILPLKDDESVMSEM